MLFQFALIVFRFKSMMLAAARICTALPVGLDVMNMVMKAGADVGEHAFQLSVRLFVVEKPDMGGIEDGDKRMSEFMRKSPC